MSVCVLQSQDIYPTLPLFIYVLLVASRGIHFAIRGLCDYSSTRKFSRVHLQTILPSRVNSYPGLQWSMTKQNEYETKSTGAFINRWYTLHNIIAP